MKIEIVDNKRIPEPGEYFIIQTYSDRVFIRLSDEDARSMVKGWSFPINLSEKIICCEINTGCILYCDKTWLFTIVTPVNPIKFSKVN